MEGLVFMVHVSADVLFVDFAKCDANIVVVCAATASDAAVTATPAAAAVRKNYEKCSVFTSIYPGNAMMMMMTHPL